MTLAEWKQFLVSQGTGKRPDSETARKSGSTLITPLLQQGLLHVSGIDAARFLQGQLTCNVESAKGNNTIPGAACNPQGRMYSSFRLMPAGEHADDGFFLRMRADIIESTLSNLSKYIVFYKAKASDQSNMYAGIGLIGENSTDCIARAFGQAPLDENQLITMDRAMIVRLPGRVPRYECWLPIDNAKQYWLQMTETADTGSVNDWILADIDSGMGEVSQAITEMFIPQMLNYDKIEAISFTKGCYTGQEVVARLQYRGKSKRTMVKLSLTDAPVLKPGQALHLPGKNQNCATIVASAEANEADTAATQHALAVISAELQDSGSLQLCLDDNCFTAQITAFQDSANRVN